LNKVALTERLENIKGYHYKPWNGTSDSIRPKGVASNDVENSKDIEALKSWQYGVGRRASFFGRRPSVSNQQGTEGRVSALGLVLITISNEESERGLPFGDIAELGLENG